MKTYSPSTPFFRVRPVNLAQVCYGSLRTPVGLVCSFTWFFGGRGYRFYGKFGPPQTEYFPRKKQETKKPRRLVLGKEDYMTRVHSSFKVYL